MQPRVLCKFRSIHARRARWGSWFVGTLLAILVVRTWLVEGLFVPLVVATDSMSPTLRGPHRNVVCGACGLRFVVDAGAQAVCPNCGHLDTAAAGQVNLPGDRVLLDKATFQLRRPRRWEVVALRDPTRPDRVALKRVVGLPDETITIRDGDVCANGRLQRKTLDQQRAVAVLVYDAAWAETTDRWRPERPGSAWKSRDGRFVHPPDADAKTADWLVYHHARRVGGQWQPSPITDLCGQASSQPRRAEDIHRLGDVLLSLRVVRIEGRGALTIRTGEGDTRFDVQIQSQPPRFELRRGDDPNPIAQGRLAPGRSPTQLDISRFDRQLLLAIDGRTRLALETDATDGHETTSTPFAIGAQELNVELDNVRIFRDVYYTHPIGAELSQARRESRPHREPGYFMLGDNSAISTDSRVWPSGPSVPAGLLVGKPFLALGSSRVMHFGRWQFQVPHLAGIRYIR